MKTGISFNTVELGLNNSCELSCVGCPSLNEFSVKKKELDFSKTLEKIKNFSIERFVLCGNSGEPLEHSQIDKILNDLFSIFPSSLIHVSTNGEKIFDNIAMETLLKISSRVVFQVSLDGPNQEIHQLTRVGGSFDKVFLNLKKLQEKNLSFEVVYTRHLENEKFAEETADLVFRTFNVDLNFRDTTIIAKNIKAPSSISKKGNVSVLYEKVKATTKLDYTPNLKYLYVDFSGACYPCISFVKHQTTLVAPNVYNQESWITFAKSFLEFQSLFCTRYQVEGDIRQCALNCGVYKNFSYDTVQSLNERGEL